MSELRTKLIRLAHSKPELRADLLPLLKQAASWSPYEKSNGHGPASDGKPYTHTLMTSTHTTNGIGPWLIVSIRGVPGTCRALQVSRAEMDRINKAVSNKVGVNYNEANRLMYELVVNNPKAKRCDPNWMLIEGVSSPEEMAEHNVKFADTQTKLAANKKYTISKPIKWKDGSVTEAGESVEVSYKRGNHTTAFLMLAGTPKGVRITNLSLYLKGYPKMPGMSALERMSDAASVPTPSGYKVEPDGYGPDGSPSWMLVAGVI